MHRRAFALFLVFAASAANGQTKRAFRLPDWYRLKTVSAPAISPDGQRVAFTVQTVNEKDNKYHREVWVASASGCSDSPASGGCDAQRLTSPGTESSNPRWSPDGRYLVFTSQRPGGKGSTWMLRMDQPGGEAFQIDSFPRGTSFPSSGAFAVWSDADSVASDSSRRDDDPFAKMQPMARPPYGSVTRPVDPARFDGRHVYDMRYKSNDRGFLPGAREARQWRPAQIWMQRFDGTPRRRITNTSYSQTGAVVSPDGQWIAFLADPRLRPDSVVELEDDSLARLPYDRARDDVDRNEQDVFVMPAAGGTPRKAASIFGNETNLRWSPDGRRIAFVAGPGRMKSDRIYVVDVAGCPASGCAPVNVIGDFRYEPNTVEWLRDGSLVFSAATGGSTGIFVVNPATKAIRQTVSGRRRINAITVDPRGRVAFVATDMTHPTELYVANVDGSAQRRLTGLNDALNAEVAWSDAERFTYTSVGGLEIEGWLMKPYGYEAGKKYPLALYIHGGPHSAYGENWFDEFQNLAAAGM